jgi:ribosomal protein S27E
VRTVADEAMARVSLPEARLMVKCPGCTRYYSEGREHACPAKQKLTGELARVSLKSLTNRQWYGIDCALCGLWLCQPAGTGTRSLGNVLDEYGHRFTLWAHDPPCVPTT